MSEPVDLLTTRDHFEARLRELGVPGVWDMAAPDVVDIQQAAEILGLSRQSIYNLMAANAPGFPPAAKLTRGFAWHRGAIEAYARGRERR